MHRRATDEQSLFIRSMMRLSQLWDWIDKRQIDAWITLIFSLWMTADVLRWAMDFADAHPDFDGLKMAAVIAAVVGPWVTMQAALIKFHFEARKSDFLPTTAPIIDRKETT